MLKSKSKPQRVRDQATEVVDRLAPHVESARVKAAPYMADAKVRATEAREKAAPYVAEAREKAAPYLAEARDRATPVVEGARTKITTEVLPVVTAAVAAASEAAEEAREEARKRSAATSAALRGQVDPPKESHKLRTFLILLGLGALAAVVAKKMSEREASTAWQSSYTPSGTPGASTTTNPPQAQVDDTPVGTAAAAAAARARDEGGAGPDEAAADADEHPHNATTPDNPAEQVRLDEDQR